MLRDADGQVDRSFYRRNYPDVAKTGADPAEHYMKHGWREGRNPSATFHTLFYKERNFAKGQFENPLLHYRANRNTAALEIFPRSADDLIDCQQSVLLEQFDCAFYRNEYNIPQDVALRHYLTTGWRDGLNPRRDFSSREYFLSHPDIAVSKLRQRRSTSTRRFATRAQAASFRPASAFAFTCDGRCWT